MASHIRDHYLWLGLGIATYITIRTTAHLLTILASTIKPPHPSDYITIDDARSELPTNPSNLNINPHRISTSSLATLATSENPSIRRNAIHIFLRRYLANQSALETLFFHLNDPKHAGGSSEEGRGALIAKDLIVDYGYGDKIPNSRVFGPYDYRPRAEDGSVIPARPRARLVERVEREQPFEDRPEEAERRRRRREAVVVRDQDDEGPLSQRDIFVRSRTDELLNVLATAALMGAGTGNVNAGVRVRPDPEAELRVGDRAGGNGMLLATVEGNGDVGHRHADNDQVEDGPHLSMMDSIHVMVDELRRVHAAERHRAAE